GDGPYCVTIVAHDPVADPPGAELSVTLDQTPPAHPGNASATNPTDEFPELHWGPGAGDAGGSGIDFYTLYRAGLPIGTVNVGAGDQQAYTDTAAGAGVTHYAVTVTDHAGNESAPSPITSEYDGPSATIRTHPPDPSRSADATFGYDASEPGTFVCSLDDGPAAA